MARHDILTALPNRTYFGELVDEDLDRRRLGHDRTVSLMIVDIDDFKHVNDTFGHIVGDELLMGVSRRLRQFLHPEAVLARLGGDEFVIYHGDVADNAMVTTDADTVLAAFESAFTLEGVTLNVSVSWAW
ncbi:MAG: GGDEF domain-containing protein [Candidatus Devosia euplotis]|nr:GGDEF domain-containing protein [Candidatus Devosia euplotis]